ncbi:hypothetical protein JT05_03185 [Desulfosporosinus sp. Tol-M]|nr:hypothetical protein JT05_03185 [Desulfosporosinus sp. Tol-M]
MDEIRIRPVGVVHSSQVDLASVIPFHGQTARIEIFPEYAGALKNIDKHSHLWILSWFHLANRELLETSPKSVDPYAPVFGVFGLRTAARPNPIGLSLVKLEQVQGRNLLVQGIDTVDGSPILDIKPYFEQDIIFSPLAPYIRPHKKEMLYQMFYVEALRHHQEECEGFYLALRMAMIAEEKLGKLHDPELLVTVVGSPCIADTVQGLTRARVANPPRFKFIESAEESYVLWDNYTRQVKTALKIKNVTKDDISNLSVEDLFDITDTELK